MSLEWTLLLLGFSAIICAMVSGVFLTFSDFVMKSLITIDPLSGVQSMQMINQKVYGSVFLILLIGMAMVSMIIIALSYLTLSGLVFIWVVSGAVSYLFGVFFVTVAFNVPMNKYLDRLDPSLIDTASYWKTYVFSWTRWNHIRTIASAYASISFFVGCMLILLNY